MHVLSASRFDGVIIIIIIINNKIRLLCFI